MISRVCATVKGHYRKMSTFKFNDYDVCGFDLDNTLLEYKLTDLFKLQYAFLSDYLTQRKGYRKDVFLKDMTDEDFDFIQRGIILDCERGNLLSLRHDGYIIKASHGTKLMNEHEVTNVYGKEKLCLPVVNLLNNKLALKNSDEVKVFLDFTDSVGTLVFAKAVDSVDLESNKKHVRYDVWPDVIESIIEMYKGDSSYNQSLMSNYCKYMYRCNEKVISWLKELKTHSKLILITGAEYEIARITVPFCFGDDFNNLFDLIVYDAQKPGFFTLKKPFTDIKGNVTDDLKLGYEYRYGNWEDMYKTLEKKLGRNPKCLYVGDNALQDIYAPTIIPYKLDTVAIIEETAGEGLYTDMKDYPHTKCVASAFWGSYLDDGLTITGDILRTCSKLVIPSLKVVASKPPSFEHKSVLKHVQV